MDKLATPMVKGSNALALRSFYNKKLQQSLLSLLASASKGLNKDLGSLHSSVSYLPTDNRLQPAVYEANGRLMAALRAGSRITVEKALLRLEKALALLPVSPGIQIGTIYQHEYQDGMIETLTSDSVLGGEVLALNPDELQREAGYCRAAMALIALHAGDMNEELQTLLVRVNLFAGTCRGYGVIGASDVRVYGDVFLRGNLYDMDHRAYYAEHLTHETSHYYLHALMAFDPLVLNDPAERYPAPIRQDPRPMFGIYHATFVLSRMVLVFEKITQATGNPAFAEALETFRRQFRNGYKVVREHGRLTPLGWKIVSGYEEMLGELVA